MLQRRIVMLSLNVRLFTVSRHAELISALAALNVAGRDPDVIVLQETRVTAADVHRRTLVGYRQFAVEVPADSSGSGGLTTFMRDGFTAHVVSSDPRALVVELRDVVPPLRVADVCRSARVDAAAVAGTRFFDLMKAVVGGATAGGAALVVAGDFNVGGISATSARWSRVLPRCAVTSSRLLRGVMETWLDDGGLTVVSGADCDAESAMSRWPSTLEMQQGACAPEIDYVDANGSVEILVDDVRTDAGGSDPCAALYGVGAFDHRALHVVMHISFCDANGAATPPAPSRTVYWWSEACGVLLAAYTAEVAPRALRVSNRLRAEIGAIPVDAASHLVTGIIDDA